MLHNTIPGDRDVIDLPGARAESIRGALPGNTSSVPPHRSSQQNNYTKHSLSR